LIVGKFGEFVIGLGLIFHVGMGGSGWRKMMVGEGMGGRCGFFLE
jgi:hypothetical protein